jgi:hypothetical protein
VENVVNLVPELTRQREEAGWFTAVVGNRGRRHGVWWRVVACGGVLWCDVV